MFRRSQGPCLGDEALRFFKFQIIQSTPENDFLPEHQAIIAKQPSVMGRFLGLFICLLMLLIILLAFLFSMDIVAVAEGKLVSKAGTQMVRSSVMGEIVDVSVVNGDKVNQGQTLMTLDHDDYLAEKQMLDDFILDTQLDIARLKALALDDPEAGFEPPQNASAKLIAQARDRLRTSQYYYQTQIDGLKMAQGDSNQPNLSDTSIRVSAFKAEFHEKRYQNLQKAEATLKELQASLTKVNEAIDARIIKAPIGGVVQGLKIKDSGMVIEPLQEIMMIAPDTQMLVAEILIKSKDRGFIQVGQAVDVKVESFPYTRHGAIKGRVEYIAQDAIALKEQGLFFPARVSLELDAVDLPLSLGMTLSTSILTGKRRMISYLLSPLEQYQTESVRER
jgi:multidrug resistance efflux pump